MPKNHNDQDMIMSPLADPVIAAIFANAEVAGLAAESLIRATLMADKQGINIGKIISVTPQSTYSNPRNRGCRVDIESISDSNEYAFVEVQLDPDITIMQRGLFSASNVFTKTSVKGDTPKEMAGKMPTVISINILKYIIRHDNNEVLQPYKIQYTKPPIVIAIPNFLGYNIQLPLIMKMEPDFTNSFYCWYYALYTAHEQGKTIQEVVDMSPQLQLYAEHDAGFKQFCEQYKLAAGDPKTREEYHWWRNDQMRSAGEWMGAYQEGERKGELRGELKATRNAVIRMTNAGMDDGVIANLLGFPITDINKFR